MAEQKFMNLGNVKKVWKNVDKKIDELDLDAELNGNNLNIYFTKPNNEKKNIDVNNITGVHKITGAVHDSNPLTPLNQKQGHVVCINQNIKIKQYASIWEAENGDKLYTKVGVENNIYDYATPFINEALTEPYYKNGSPGQWEVNYRGDNNLVSIQNSDDVSGPIYYFKGHTTEPTLLDGPEKGTYINNFGEWINLSKNDKKFNNYAEISKLAKINGENIYDTSEVILNDNHIKTSVSHDGVSDNFLTNISDDTSLNSVNQILLNNDCFLNKKFEDYPTLSNLNTIIYSNISSADDFNSIKNGAVVNATEPIKIGEEVFAKGTYVKSDDTLVSINAPKVVDVDLTEYARLDDLKKSRNYAKGTGYALRFDQIELGSSSNVKPNDGNCFMYPISGLKQGDLVTVSFDWYYKDEDGIDNAFNQYGEDTGDTSLNTQFVISMGIEYNYGGGPFVDKSNYEQYKISDTEIKGHCSMNVTINLGDVNTVSYPYVQNQFVGVNGSNHYLEISNFMVTKGGKEMPWSPAPEDNYGFIYNIDYPGSDAPRFKIMPGLYNKLKPGELVNNINCGFRQLASTNNPIPKYIFEWIADSQSSLVLSSNVKWVNNEIPAFTIGYIYRVTIEDNFAECKQIEVPEAIDFSFPKNQIHKITDESSEWYYWQADDGDYLYTKPFDLGLIAGIVPTAYTDSNLSIRKAGEFSYEENEVIINGDDAKRYNLLHKIPGIYIKYDNNYITCLRKY